MSDIINAIVPIEAIQPHPRNYKVHPPLQIANLKASHKRFQQYRSVVIWQRPNNEYIQVAGHGILEAMKERGVTHVRADILPEDTPEEDIEGILIADNNLPLGAVDNEELLAMLLQEQQDAGYDLASLGSDDETLRQMLESLGDGYLSSDEQVDGAGGDEFDTTPDEGPTRTQVGDLWQLGDKHRLLVGDSTDPEQVARLMQGEKAVLSFEDPPYGVAYQTKLNVEEAVARHRRTDGLEVANDAMTPEQTSKFLQTAFEVLREHVLCPGGVFYICSPSGDMETVFRNALDAARLKLRECIVWVKDHFVMGRQDYHWRHESILYGWNDGAAHYFIDDRTQDTVWEVDRPMRSEDHPTTKPLELSARAINNSSKPNDIVYDGFAGSGTTLISCQCTGRKARVIEIDPHYVDVILKRYEAETNQQAQLLERVEVLAHA